MQKEILITNDDGLQARGIQTLARVMTQSGHVTVVAPTGARSGQSNAITVKDPVYLNRVPSPECEEFPAAPEIDWYACSGTPSDCIKIALTIIYGEDRKPDLVVSGINHGSNASVCVIYSGTMGATFVAAENGIPAIGFSLCDHRPEADFHFLEPYVAQVVERVLSVDTPYGVVYNVNAPQGPLKGLRLARQCRGHWGKEWIAYQDPAGKPFYLLTGNFYNHEPESHDTDEYWLSEGYATLVPQSIDMTDYKMLKHLEGLAG